MSNYTDVNDPELVAARMAMEEEIARKTERIMALTRKLQMKQAHPQPQPVAPQTRPMLRLVKPPAE